MTDGTPPDERLARIALTRIVEPGDEAVGRLLRRTGPVDTLSALRAGAPAPDELGSTRWAGLRARLGRGAAPEADLERITALDGSFVCPGDHGWPRQLDDLGTARPIGLWTCGRSSLRFRALHSVAVVGARACTDYGAHVASALASGLAARGWTVVSGAAYGIDAAAHRGALGAGGGTVGVLACGVDEMYPPGNAELIRRLGEQGLLVAELPPGAHPTRSRFILRNRVIAALTRGTVVVEAALRSGSLSTVRHARRLGRFTMGTPGPVTSGLSSGVHELLRDDGTVVTDANEVIELVGRMGDLAPGRRGAELPRDALPHDTARALDALPARRAVDARHVAREAGMQSAEALVRLQELWALGFVERQGDFWQLAPPRAQHPIE